MAIIHQQSARLCAEKNRNGLPPVRSHDRGGSSRVEVLRWEGFVEKV